MHDSSSSQSIMCFALAHPHVTREEAACTHVEETPQQQQEDERRCNAQRNNSINTKDLLRYQLTVLLTSCFK